MKIPWRYEALAAGAEDADVQIGDVTGALLTSDFENDAPLRKEP